MTALNKLKATGPLSKNEEKIPGSYKIEKTIGKGNYAVVKLASHIFTGQKVAIKVIDKTKLDLMNKIQLFQEVNCMKLVRHPNVVKLYEVIDTPTKLYLILELGEGGDLYDYILKHDRGIEENKAKVYFRQILNAIIYCHKMHVVHRDLKPENVIFFDNYANVKLTDFGFSNKFKPGQKLETSCGSLAYSAPEILLGDQYDAQAIDIWSLGVLLYMLVVGKCPFLENNDNETITMIIDCKYTMPENLSPECKDLISKMLVKDPGKRAHLDEILRHPWLRLNNTQGINGAFADKNQVVDGKITSLLTPLNPNAEFYSTGFSRSDITEDVHKAVINKMVNAQIVTEHQIKQSLRRDCYNHVTATYYLLAEKLLKSKNSTNNNNAANPIANNNHIAPMKNNSYLTNTELLNPIVSSQLPNNNHIQTSVQSNPIGNPTDIISNVNNTKSINFTNAQTENINSLSDDKINNNHFTAINPPPVTSKYFSRLDTGGLLEPITENATDVGTTFSTLPRSKSKVSLDVVDAFSANSNQSTNSILTPQSETSHFNNESYLPYPNNNGLPNNSNTLSPIQQYEGGTFAKNYSCSSLPELISFANANHQPPDNFYQQKHGIKHGNNSTIALRRTMSPLKLESGSLRLRQPPLLCLHNRTNYSSGALLTNPTGGAPMINIPSLSDSMRILGSDSYNDDTDDSASLHNESNETTNHVTKNSNPNLALYKACNNSTLSLAETRNATFSPAGSEDGLLSTMLSDNNDHGPHLQMFQKHNSVDNINHLTNVNHFFYGSGGFGKHPTPQHMQHVKMLAEEKYPCALITPKTFKIKEFHNDNRKKLLKSLEGNDISTNTSNVEQSSPNAVKENTTQDIPPLSVSNKSPDLKHANLIEQNPNISSPNKTKNVEIENKNVPQIKTYNPKLSGSVKNSPLHVSAPCIFYGANSGPNPLNSKKYMSAMIPSKISEEVELEEQEEKEATKNDTIQPCPGVSRFTRSTSSYNPYTSSTFKNALWPHQRSHSLNERSFDYQMQERLNKIRLSGNGNIMERNLTDPLLGDGGKNQRKHSSPSYTFNNDLTQSPNRTTPNTSPKNLTPPTVIITQYDATDDSSSSSNSSSKNSDSNSLQYCSESQNDTISNNGGDNTIEKMPQNSFPYNFNATNTSNSIPKRNMMMLHQYGNTIPLLSLEEIVEEESDDNEH